MTLISLNIIILLSHVLSQKKNICSEKMKARIFGNDPGRPRLAEPTSPDCQVLPLSILSRSAVLAYCVGVTVHRYTGHCAAPQQKG